MKITVTIRTTETKDNGTHSDAFSQKIDTDAIELDDVQGKFLDAIASGIASVKDAGYDLKISSHKLSEFFDKEVKKPIKK